VSTDDRTSRQYQQKPTHETANTAAAMRRRTALAAASRNCVP
jgi:hypothetical protein